jgi:hypothetical protein
MWLWMPGGAACRKTREWVYLIVSIGGPSERRPVLVPPAVHRGGGHAFLGGVQCTPVRTGGQRGHKRDPISRVKNPAAAELKNGN